MVLALMLLLGRGVPAQSTVSPDATLSALHVSGIDFGSFSSESSTYTARVEHPVESTTVTATPADPTATVTITDENGSTTGSQRTVSLAEGPNSISITVTAPDGLSELTYALIVQRAADSAAESRLGNVPFEADELWKPVAVLRSLRYHPKRPGHGKAFVVGGYYNLIWDTDRGGQTNFGGVDVFDLSDPRNPIKVATHRNRNTERLREAHGLGLWNRDGQIVLAAQSHKGVVFFDVSQIRYEMPLLSEIDLPNIEVGDYTGAWWLSFQAPYVYVNGAAAGLYVVDASDPTAPRLVARYRSGSLGGRSFRTVSALGNLLVMTNVTRVSTFDIGTPEVPRALDSLSTCAGTYSSVFVAGMAFASSRDSGKSGRLCVDRILHDGSIEPAGRVAARASSGKYGSYQDGHFVGGFASAVVKFDVETLERVGRGTSGLTFRDESFSQFIGNLVFTGDDHGAGSALIPHQLEPDRNGPDVVWIHPADGASEQPVTTRVGVSMSDQIAVESLTASSFLVRPSWGKAVPGQLSVNENNVNFFPDEPLDPGVRYEVMICGLADIVGNSGGCFESSFTTTEDPEAGTNAPTCDLGPPSPSEVGAVRHAPAAIGNGPAASYTWEFWDGTVSGPSSRPDVAHTYDAPGRYPIRLTVSNPNGSSDCSAVQIVHRALTERSPAASTTIQATETVTYVVNPDNDSVTRISGDGGKDWEAAVGEDPRTLAIAPNGHIWVANQGSGTISILTASGTLHRTIELGYGADPYAVVFAPDGRSAYVALPGSGRLLKLSVDGEQVGLIRLSSPRGIAVTADSRSVLVTRFVSAFAAGGATGEVYVVDADTFRLRETVPLAYDPGPDAEDGGRGLPNYLAQVRISPDGLTAWVPSKKDNIARGRHLDGQDLSFENTTRAIASEIDLSVPAENLSRRIDFDDRSLPQAVAFTPNGDVLAVALQGSNIVEFRDANALTMLSEVNVGRAPDGLAFRPDGSRLFVHNFLDRTVSVVDTSGLVDGTSNQPSLLSTVSLVSSETLPAAALRGKRIFYDAADPRMSLDGYIACASCHLDGGSDRMVWDRTQFGEGLRNTIDLRGRKGANGGFVHWSSNFDEIQDFEHDIRDAFGGTGFMANSDFTAGTRDDPLGDPKAGLSEELDDLAAYVESLAETPDSPYRGANGELTQEGDAGRLVFVNRRCFSCHLGQDFTDDLRHDVGTLQASSGGGLEPGVNTPTLKGLWLGAPYLHDGRHETLNAVLGDTAHMGAELAETEKANLAAYLLQIDDSEDGYVNVAATVSIERVEPDDRILEGESAAFTVTRTGEVTAPLTVVLSAEETGSMTGEAPTSSVLFEAGETSRTLNVQTVDDSVVEAASTITVTLLARDGYAVGVPSKASAVVEDNDVAVFGVSLQPSRILEGESATLSVAVSDGVTFAEAQTISLSKSGTASASDDYSVVPDPLTLAAGASSVTGALTAARDYEEEELETVTVTASHGDSAIGSATVTIESVSRDATLSTLSLSGIDIGTFSAARTAYTASVAHGTTSTTVTATPSHGGALASIDPGPEVSLAEGTNEITVTVTAEDGETARVYTVAVTRAGPPLTASWASLPESHSGSGTAVLQVLFSEPVSTSSVTLRDESFHVTNGLVDRARRVNGRSDLWEIQIRPFVHADLVVMLPATADCEAAGAVCTDGGKALSAPLEATIPWVTVVSVVAVASPVSEGGRAELTVSRTGPASSELTARLSRTSSKNDEVASMLVRFGVGQRNVAVSELFVDTDTLVEDDYTVTWTLEDGEGYAVSAEAGSAQVVVEENDQAAFTVSVEPETIAEGESATLTVAISNGVTFAEEQAFTLAVSGTASLADYSGLPDSLALTRGASSVTAELAASKDQVDEEAETVTITASHGDSSIGSATVTITSASHDATLRALSLSGIDIGTFSSATTAYTALVPNEVSSTTVSATASHEGASVSIAPRPELTLAEGPNEITVTVTAADGETTKIYAVTVTRATEPLTASFASLPASHTGTGTVTLRIQFSEPVSTSDRALRDEGFLVTSGQVRQAGRVNGRDDLWEIQIEPSADADLVVVLPATADCEAAGAVCTDGGKALSAPLEATIPWVTVVSVAAVASAVSEGGRAELTVSRTGLASSELTARLSKTSSKNAEVTSVLVRFGVGQRSVAVSELFVDTDTLVEDDYTVTWTLEDGEGYTVSAEAGSAQVVVEENDQAAFTVSVEPETIAEGESATLTVAISNGVTFAEDQTVMLAVSSTALAVEQTGVFRGLALVAGESSATVKLLALNEQGDEQAETVTVTASHGGSEIGSATVTIDSISRDATLSALSLSGIDIGTFSKAETSYAASVEHAVETTTVTAPASHPEALVSIEPGSEVVLAVGVNKIAVRVTAEDGATTRTYTVTVTRAEEPALPVVSLAVARERVVGPLAYVWVSRTGPTEDPLEVGLLRLHSDRAATSTQTAQFRRGQRRVRKGVQIGDNNLVEDDITVTWRLQEGEGYTVSAEQSSASVVLEESEVPEFAVTAEPAVIAEGERATVRVAITNGVRFPQAETIALAVGGTASESDYTGLPATLALPARGTLATARLTAVADGTAEAAETVVIAASHAGQELGTATVTIGASEASALTAQFTGIPERHGGAAAAFAFELRFSEEVRISHLTLRDTAFQVTAGAVTGARRLAPPSNLRWEITVEPASDADLVLALPVTTDCAAQGAVCTSSGKALSERIEATVRGPGSEPSGEGFPLARENSRPSGIWSDGETAWVADQEDARLYAYRRSDGERQPERDIATGPAPMGLWSDGETLWVAGLGGGIRAHRLANGSRQPWRDLGLEANAAPAGIWSDGRTLWAADWLGSAAHAYRLADGQRRPGRDIELDGGNLMPAGLWSDGQTLWVADWRERVYAYRLADGGRAARRDIEAGAADTDPTGLWSAGGTLLATGWEGAEVRAYRFPEAVETAPEKKSGGGLVARAASMPAIADPALQAAIGKALGKAPEEAVSPQDLAGLEALTARNAGIRNLSGLEQAVSLKELDLGFNPLRDLEPLAGLSELVSLNLDGAVTDLQALAPLARLQRLSLRNNGIADLAPLAGLVSLSELDLGDNRIADLRPLAGLGRLGVLRADRNLIADLWPLASLAGLEALDLGANRVRDVQPLAGLARLQSLRLGGNGLSELHALLGLGALRDLGLAANAVEDLTALSRLSGLRRLDLRGNPVGDLRPLRALESLAWVHVGGSRIEDLTPVDGLSGLIVAGRNDREPPSLDADSAIAHPNDD